MNKPNTIILAGFVAATTLIGAASASAEDCTPETTLGAFFAAVDAGDAAALESVLHPNFRVMFTVIGTDEVIAMDRAGYIAGIESGQMGGAPRAVAFGPATGAGALWTQAATLDGASGHFESVYSLATYEGTCMLVQDATVYTPPSE